MAIDMIHRLQARRASRLHVQLELEQKPATVLTPGDVPLQGQVVRVFRGEGMVAPGTTIRLALPVYRDGDMLPPGRRHLLWAEVQRARYLEVYLDGEWPDVRVTDDEFAIIDAPTAKAVLQEEDVAGSGGLQRRWWEFWKS